MTISVDIAVSLNLVPEAHITLAQRNGERIPLQLGKGNEGSGNEIAAPMSRPINLLAEASRLI